MQPKALRAQSDPVFVQSLGKAMRVLEAFRDSDAPLSLAEISSRAGITRSAAQRIVHSFRQLGYMRLSDDGRGFLLDLGILDLTYNYLRMHPLIRRATPILQELRRTVRERVDLSLFDGQRMVYAARLQSKREVFFATLIGHSVPTYCTSGGWAVLAMLPDDEVNMLLSAAEMRQVTPRTLTDPQAIREQIELTRQNGHSLAIEQILMGEVAIGVAISGSDNRPAGAIHIAGNLSEWQPEEFRRHVAPLASAAASAMI
ncbi:IclR family transcriptional regulator [Paracoccus onubensis]|nr:IclR family transcriptional regulator [Paracoccus onubensis]